MQDVLRGVFAHCSEHLPRVDGALLDCVSDDIALLLAARGVADVHDPFARDWRFDLRRTAHGPPRLDLPPADQDDLLAERTGLRPDWRPIDAVTRQEPRWCDALSAGEPVLLVGDAYHMPWLPYHGHEHMDHGFVLEGLSHAGAGAEDGPWAHLADPYDNATEWGHARPTTLRLPLRELAPALDGGRWAVLVADSRPRAAADPEAQVAANAAAITSAAEQGAYEEFCRGHAALGLDELRNLTLQTWLLARSRRLHAQWLAGQSGGAASRLAPRFAEQVADGWKRAAESCYVALRRARSGKRPPRSALATVERVAEAEIELARGPDVRTRHPEKEQT